MNSYSLKRSLKKPQPWQISNVSIKICMDLKQNVCSTTGYHQTSLHQGSQTPQQTSDSLSLFDAYLHPKHPRSILGHR